MLIYLGIGVVIVFLLARLAMNAARNAIIGGIADGDVRGAAQTIVDATLRDLRGVTVLIIIATVVVVIAAYLWGRPRWVMATTAYVSDTAGRAGSAAGAAASGGASGVAGRAPDRETVERTVRENRSVIERYGLAIVVFILFWLALGLGIALLGAALVVGFELILRAVAGPSGDEATETSFERSAGDGEPAVVAPSPDEVTSTYAAPAAVEPVTVVAPAAAVVEALRPRRPRPGSHLRRRHPRRRHQRRRRRLPRSRARSSRPRARRSRPPPDRPTDPRVGRSSAQTPTGASSFSMRIAVALNSAVPDFGSVASIVSRFDRDVVLEVERHERQARAERRVDPDRDLDLAAARDDPDDLALGSGRRRRHPPG